MATGLFNELRRRHVFRAAVVYAVVSWVVLQITDIVVPAVGLPDWAITLVLVLLLVRLWWRRGHPPPGPTANMSARQASLSTLMHRALYVLFLLQVFFGIGQAMFLTEYPVMAFGIIGKNLTNNLTIDRIFTNC